MRKFRGVDDPEPPQDGVKVEFREDLTIATNNEAYCEKYEN